MLTDSPSGTAPTDVTPADPSTAPVATETPVSDAANPGVTADSPTVQQDAEPPAPTLKDALVDAVAAKVDPKVDPATDAQPAKPAADPKAADPKKPKAADVELKPEDKVDAAGKPLPFGEHPRWKEMVGSNRTLATENSTLKQQLEQVAPRVQEYELLTGFMAENEISQQELHGMLRLTAMMKSDPAAALETLQAIVRPLQEHVGEVLPADLQKEVDEGVTTQERAKEIVQLRNQRALEAANSQRQDQRQVAQATRDAAMAKATAVSNWEREQIASNPDYPELKEWVALELRRLQAERPAATVEAAVELAKEAYKNVSTKFKQTIQRGRPEVPRTPNAADAPNAGGARPVPATLKDAIAQAVL